MMNDRRRRVLSALVEEYIASAQPVGSKNLVDRYDLGCSPATVRNELSILEETGYVFQPHVSAGRMPTDSGYRSFVDELTGAIDGITQAEAEELAAEYFATAAEIDDLMKHTSVMLSQLTHYVAVVLAPTISLARIRRLDLLSMGAQRAVFVLITEQGQVVNRHIKLPSEATPERIAEVEHALNASLQGKRADQIRVLRDALSSPDGGSVDTLMTTLLDEVLDALQEADRDRLHHVGMPDLLTLPEFTDSEQVRPLVGLLEDGLAMLETLHDVMQSGGVTVRIGSENTASELGNLSLVATKYGTGNADGIVGVIGPTRMDYNRAITAVRCVADGLSETLR